MTTDFPQLGKMRILKDGVLWIALINICDHFPPKRAILKLWKRRWFEHAVIILPEGVGSSLFLVVKEICKWSAGNITAEMAFIQTTRCLKYRAVSYSHTSTTILCYLWSPYNFTIAVGGKAPRKQPACSSSCSITSSPGSKDKYSGGNPVRWMPTPSWQKGMKYNENCNNINCLNFIFGTYSAWFKCNSKHCIHPSEQKLACN